jgi:hypothetical protein
VNHRAPGEVGGNPSATARRYAPGSHVFPKRLLPGPLFGPPQVFGARKLNSFDRPVIPVRSAHLGAFLQDADRDCHGANRNVEKWGGSCALDGSASRNAGCSSCTGAPSASCAASASRANGTCWSHGAILTRLGPQREAPHVATRGVLWCSGPRPQSGAQNCTSESRGTVRACRTQCTHRWRPAPRHAQALRSVRRGGTTLNTFLERDPPSSSTHQATSIRACSC